MLRYRNDKQKATELTFTLQWRVKDNSAAYNQNILLKSDLVNNFILNANMENMDLFSFTTSEQVHPIVDTEVSHSTENTQDQNEHKDFIRRVEEEVIKIMSGKENESQQALRVPQRVKSGSFTTLLILKACLREPYRD